MDVTTSFKDVSPAKWYASTVAVAAREVLIRGDGTNRFHPEEGISREEAVVMLVAAMHYADGQSSSNVGDSLSPYQDADAVSSWAKDAMAEAVQSELLIGNDKQQLLPKEIVSRAEASAMLDRMLRKIGFIN